MLHLILSAVLAHFLLAAEPQPLDRGTQLNFRGSVDARAEDPDKGRKSFDLTLWILRKDATAAEVFWLVEERGRGEFPWTERFGRQTLDAHSRSAAPGPSLLYDRGDGRSVVPIPLPFLAAERAAGRGRARSMKASSSSTSTRPARPPNARPGQSACRDPFGPKRMLKVDQLSPLVLTLTERLTMGRGEEYQLQLEFVGSEQLVGEPLAALTAAIDKLAALRGKLNLPAGSQELSWKAEQVELLRTQLPLVAEVAAATPLARLVSAAGRDVQLQSGRNDAVAEMAAKHKDRPVEDFKIKGLGDDALRPGRAGRPGDGAAFLGLSRRAAQGALWPGRLPRLHLPAPQGRRPASVRRGRRRPAGRRENARRRRTERQEAQGLHEPELPHPARQWCPAQSSLAIRGSSAPTCRCSS